jgi:hypothetical protein
MRDDIERAWMVDKKATIEQARRLVDDVDRRLTEARLQRRVTQRALVYKTKEDGLVPRLPIVLPTTRAIDDQIDDRRANK